MSLIPVIAVLALLLLLPAAWIFNRLVGLRNRAASAWSDVDVQLKRRHDLVGNLVETVKGYARHERAALEAVAVARGAAEGARQAGRPAAAGAAETELGGRVLALYAVAEAYPELEAAERFADLQRGLTEVEDDLQNARRYYNAVVRDLNTRIQSLPDLLVARALGFDQREFFALEDRLEAAAPQVRLEEGE